MSSRYLVVRRGEKVRVQCQRSGRCCTSGPNVGLTAFDVCRIAKYLGVDWRELRGKYIIAIVADVFAVPALRGVGTGRCAFLKYEERVPVCTIYPVRPLRCRLYPFLPASPSVRDKVYVDTYCPGVGKGEEIEPPWKLLDIYYDEQRRHYERLFELVFKEGYEPLEALEKLIDEVCEQYSISIEETDPTNQGDKDKQ